MRDRVDPEARRSNREVEWPTDQVSAPPSRGRWGGIQSGDLVVTSATLPAMLSDLDALLTSRGIEAAIVPMHETLHPSFRWISRGAKITRGYAVKLAGREPIL